MSFSRTSRVMMPFSLIPIYSTQRSMSDFSLHISLMCAWLLFWVKRCCLERGKSNFGETYNLLSSSTTARDDGIKLLK